jgi:hypothetical protein
MRIIVSIILALVCVDVSLENGGANEPLGFTQLRKSNKVEPPIRHQKTQIVWGDLRLDWNFVLDPRPADQWGASAGREILTSANGETSLYFDPNSVYFRTDDAVPFQRSFLRLYMSACKLHLRHYCLR